VLQDWSYETCLLIYYFRTHFSVKNSDFDSGIIKNILITVSVYQPFDILSGKNEKLSVKKVAAFLVTNSADGTDLV
jgi:hypothetical protein